MGGWVGGLAALSAGWWLGGRVGHARKKKLTRGTVEVGGSKKNGTQAGPESVRVM